MKPPQIQEIQSDLDAPLVFEYVLLSVVDLSIPFVRRFTGPLVTAWVPDASVLPQVFVDGHTVAEALQTHALRVWEKMILDNRLSVNAFVRPHWDRLRRSTVTLRECVIVPKESGK